MGSSGGGGGGGYYPGMFGSATPMPGLPVAGAGSTIGDPYEYGKFQNFLPDIKAEGQNDMATGLRPSMFNYTKPNPGGGTLAGNSLSSASEIQGLRDQLAAIQAQLASGGGAGAAPKWYDDQNGLGGAGGDGGPGAGAGG
jgi:hypothetical protein